MKNLSLILRILAVIAAIAATALYFTSKGKLADKQAELTQTQDLLDSTQKKLSDTNNTLKKTETKLKRESESLANTKKSLEEVRSELFAAQQDSKRNERELGEARTQIGQLETDLRKVRSDLVTTQEALASASNEAEINQLNGRIAELKDANDKLKLELEQASAVAKAVTNRQNPTAAGGLGSINTSVTSLSSGEPIQRIRLETTVNSISTDAGLIVLASTPELGLAAGQTIVLVQDLKSVGKVQIQSVEDTYAIANILPGSTGASKLDTGSKVQLLL